MTAQQVPNIRPPQSSDDALMASFQGQMNKNELADILKELFDDKKIELITDLTKDEVKLITRIIIIADMKKLSVWRQGIQWYLKLVLSKNRQSRKELLDAIRGQPIGQNFFQRMNPFNRGRMF